MSYSGNSVCGDYETPIEQIICPDCQGDNPFVSACCEAIPHGNEDMDTKDAGICPECKDQCDYIQQECKRCESTGYIDSNSF